MLPVGASALTPPFSVPDDRCWTLGNDCLTSAPEFNHAQEISSLNNVNNKRDVHMSLVEPKWETLRTRGENAVVSGQSEESVMVVVSENYKAIGLPRVLQELLQVHSIADLLSSVEIVDAWNWTQCLVSKSDSLTRRCNPG